MARPDDDRGGACCGLHSRLSMRDRYPNGRKKGAELSLRVNRLHTQKRLASVVTAVGMRPLASNATRNTENKATSRNGKSLRHETSGFQRPTDIAPALKLLAIAMRSLYVPSRLSLIFGASPRREF